MGEKAALFRGWVRNGVVVPEEGLQLPEGAEVRFALAPPAPSGPPQFTPEERAEFDAWDQLSDEAWRQIDWGTEEIARDAG
jgi:hypothetical protein